MSFLNTLVSKLGFNQENPKTAFYPTPTGAPIVKQSPGQQAMTNLSKPSPFIETLTKNLPAPKIIKPIAPTVKRPDITFQDIGSVVNKVGREVITRPIRTVIKSFEELGGYLGDENYSPEPFVPKTPVEKALFGEAPIKSYPEQGKDIIKMSKDIQKPVTGMNGEVFFKGIPKQYAIPLAFFGTIGAPLGDLLPGGGEKKKVVEGVFKGVIDDIIEAGVKVNKNEDAFKLFKEAGIDDEFAKEAAPALTVAKNKNDVENIIRNTATKQAQKIEDNAVKRIEEITNKKNGITIAEDGSKVKGTPTYLTADETDELNFLRANKNKPANIMLANKAAEANDVEKQQTFYHATNTDNVASIKKNGFNPLVGDRSLGVTKGEGTFLYENYDNAKTFEKNFPNGTTLKTNIDGKIFDASSDKFPSINAVAEDKPFIDSLKEKGFVAVKGEESGIPVTFVFDKTAIKNIRTVEEIKALDTARGAEKERKYITSAKANERVANEIKTELQGVYDVKGNKDLVQRASERVNQNIETAKKMATTESTDEAVATGVSLTEHYSNEIEHALTRAEKVAIGKEAADVINKQAEILTEAGRTVQAASLLGKTTPEGMLRTTARMIKDFNKTAKNKLPELTGEAVVDILEKGKAIEKMPEGMAKDIAKKELTDKLESLIPSPWWKKIITVWKAGLLTGIKTSGVNIQSNFWHGFAEKTKDIPATGIDLATSLFTGNRTKSFTLNGGVKGSMEGIKKGWDYLKTGIEHGAGESALEFGKVHFDSKPGKVLEAYANGVYRILGAEDMPFFYGALRRSLAEQALVEIKNSKKVFANSAERSKFIQNAIDNPSEEALKLADMDAKVATFKNDTKLGNAATSVRNAHPIVEFLLPFAKTPSAVATAMFNYTPAGALSTLYRNFIKGSFNQKDFAEGLGRAATGMGALWLGSKLYEKGKIALDYPSDQKTQNEWEATGKTANSILINGKWVPLVSFGPAGSVLGIGGYVQKGKDETGSVSGGVVSGFFGGVKGLTEQTFLTGVKNLIDTINAPEKKGQQFVGGLAASVVPTIVSDFNQAFDQYQRKSNDLLDPLKARIPGLRQTLHPKLDVWGQPIERNRTALATAISPIRLSNRIEGPFNTEVERLKMEGEDVAPTKADAKIKNIKLNDDEYYMYQKLYGKVLEKGLTALIENPDYQKQDPDQQAKLFKDAISDVRKATGEAILPEILRKRYDLSPEIDMTETTTLINELYKKSPDFAKASLEKQKKVIEKFLNK